MASGLGRFQNPAFVACLVSAAAAVVVTLPSVTNGFVYDDVWVVQQNDVVHNLQLKELLQSTYWPQNRGGAMWRPAALVGFGLEWALGGGGATIFHVASIGLYGLVTGLVALLGVRLFSPTVGLVGGILFAVHPVHVEVTANIVGQAELIAAAGYLVAMLAMWERGIRDATGPRAALLGAAVLGFAIGLGGKEHGLTFPGAVMVLWWLVARRRGLRFKEIVRREWMSLIPVVLVALIYLVLRAQVVGEATDAGGIATGLSRSSILERSIVMLPVSLEWLRLLFFPVHLSADYSPLKLVPQATFGFDHAMALVMWSTILALVWLKRNKATMVAGVALFLVTISITSNLLVPLEILLAERLLFLPSVGWAFVVAGVMVPEIGAEGSRGSMRRLGFLVAIAVALFAARSVWRATIWHDNDRFFAQLLEDAPDSFRSHWALGWFAFERGDSVAGERETRTAIRLNPDHPQLLEDMGLRYAASDRYEPAIPLLARAVALDSNRLSSALPLAVSLGRSGRTGEATQVLNAMARLHGETRGIAIVRGEVLMNAQQFDSALAVLEILISREPKVWAVRKMAAEAAARAGRCGTALAQADTAMELAPESERTKIQADFDRVANGKLPCK